MTNTNEEKPKTRAYWTEDNIMYLKMAYLKGVPLKQMAATLNRTVSAINKVLARHNLRTHTKAKPIPSFGHPTPGHLAQKRELGTSTRKKNAHAFKCLPPDYRLYVSIEQVVRWLRSEGDAIVQSATGDYYEVNGYPKNKQQILYRANLRREERQLSLFFVKGVTWE